ncbi:hypothetical protein [Collinsella ihumii]|uniref:HEAT repeat domain-containing protein n=1 Tax=Collinsella ihumii TaxID=1720204 RepID=A0AAW7JXL8_9ACTN|nr:hypothetical protein [Collinsella ihumii]MDN0068220.1 hypothetical protein [Collinsella ihumii]
MSVQVFIGFYALISIMMIMFDIVFLQWESLRDWQLKRLKVYMSHELREEIARNLDFPTPEHRNLLCRRLKRLSGMESFDLTMEQLYIDSPSASEHYLSGIDTVFEELVPYFSRKDVLRRAYFAAIIKRWYRCRPAAPSIIDTLYEDIRVDALFTRQNAFEAVVQIGRPSEIVYAVSVLDEASIAHSTRLISETLLMYPNDSDELADALLKAFSKFSLTMKICIVNYLRLSDSSRTGREGAPEDRFRFIKQIMDDEDADMDLRLACARYFMHNPWNPALATLIKFARMDNEAEWEYSAVAALVLASYPCTKTTQALKRCVKSPIYYVRFNAAQSLYRLGLSLETDLADIVHGGDRYARDMLLYRWEIERRRQDRLSASTQEAMQKDPATDDSARSNLSPSGASA